MISHAKGTRSVAVGIWPKRMMLGQGSLDALPALVRELGARRALVLCGKTVASGALLDRVRAALGPLFAGLFDRVGAHTPLTMVEEALAAAEAAGADALVSVGGGSAIDAGKGIVLLSMAGRSLDAYTVRHGPDERMEQPRLPRSRFVHIAVPTTHGSASEVMPTAGIRDVAMKKKLLFWDDALIPDGVILDPRMTVQTGPALTAASGMTAVARCVESLYSVNRNPFAAGLALHGLRLLYEHLPVVTGRPDDLEARYACQVACSMSGVAAINSMVSLVHALGHIVGGRYGLQHGVSHAILLGPAMRVLIAVIGDDQQLVWQALGGPPGLDAANAGRESARRIDELVARLGLKTRLRELGIPAEDLGEIAAQALGDYMMINMPRAIALAEIEGLLREAW